MLGTFHFVHLFATGGVVDGDVGQLAVPAAEVGTLPVDVQDRKLFIPFQENDITSQEYHLRIMKSRLDQRDKERQEKERERGGERERERDTYMP